MTWSMAYNKPSSSLMESYEMDVRHSSLSAKRKYDAVGPNEEIEDDSPDETLYPINSADLTFFSCSKKIKDMHPSGLSLLEHFPQLPERTQYFDMGVLIRARLDPEDYYFDKLAIWREVSTLYALS